MLRTMQATALALLLASSAFAQAPVLEPLGLALENHPYPHPVRFFPVTVEGQDLRMAYMDVAPTAAANGQTVLLLHGKNFFGAYWAGTIQALTAAGYRVVVPDQLGFGKSSKPDLRASMVQGEKEIAGQAEGSSNGSSLPASVPLTFRIPARQIMSSGRSRNRASWRSSATHASATSSRMTAPSSRRASWPRR